MPSPQRTRSIPISAADALRTFVPPVEPASPSTPPVQPSNYVIDEANAVTSFEVGSHRVTVRLVAPTSDNNRLPNGDEIAATGEYTIEPIGTPDNPCRGTWPVWQFTQQGYLFLKRGLPSNFPLPVTGRSHLRVRGVNDND